MSDCVRLAIVGCGGIAGEHLRGYRLLAEHGCQKFEIAAVCDPVPERTAQFSQTIAEFQTTKPKSYTSLGAMLEKERLDGADVCVAHYQHHTAVIACLEAGVHAMTEKPFAITIKAAKKMIEASVRTGTILATAENSRRGLGQRTARWAIQEKGLIGQPRMFFNQTCNWGPQPPEPPFVSLLNWRMDRLMMGGGWSLDGGVHFMDTLIYFFGEVERVYAELANVEQRKIRHETKGVIVTEGEDTCLATFHFKNGLFGSWLWTNATTADKREWMAYYGSEGFLEDRTRGGSIHAFGGGFIESDGDLVRKDGVRRPLRDLEAEYLLSLDRQTRDRLFPHGVSKSVAIECHDFVEAIATGHRPEVDGWDGLKALAVSEAMYESAHSGQAVRVDDVISGAVEGYQRELNERWGI